MSLRTCLDTDAPPGDVGNDVHDRVAKPIAPDLQHTPRDEQEEQEDSAQTHDQVHPHALSVRRETPSS